MIAMMLPEILIYLMLSLSPFLFFEHMRAAAAAAPRSACTQVRGAIRRHHAATLLMPYVAATRWPCPCHAITPLRLPLHVMHAADADTPTRLMMLLIRRLRRKHITRGTIQRAARRFIRRAARAAVKYAQRPEESACYIYFRYCC